MSGWVLVVSVLQAASACNTDTTQTQPHQISNTQRTEKKTTDVVIQQHSRKLLMMDILMSETCWVCKKWNKTASDINLVFYSSTITMIYGPINIRSKQLNFFSNLSLLATVTVFHNISILFYYTKNINWRLIFSGFKLRYASRVSGNVISAGKLRYIKWGRGGIIRIKMAYHKSSYI